jgi:2,5-diketo-D-gluconate reductase B
MDYLDLHGTRIPRLGFGTWELEGSEAEEGVRDALEIGYRHIDTARMYGNEREVGRALAASEVDRDDVWVTTKIWRDDLAPDRVRASAEASLRDLGLDAVDLLLIHWPNPDHSLQATLEAMLELKEQGRTRHIGVSNFPPALLQRALGLAPILTDQVEYHPFLGQGELLAIAQAGGASLTAYSPLAHGKTAKDKTLKQIGKAHDKTGPQVALRWLLDRPGVMALPRSSSHDNRLANFEVFDFELTEDERAQIDALPKDARDVSPSWAPDWDD